METAVVRFFSNWPHCSQILTGFRMLEKAGYLQMKLEDHRNDSHYENRDTQIVMVEYKGKTIIYDTADSFPNVMQSWVGKCDVYFKRSFSPEMIAEKYPAYADKFRPLGMNYHVTYPQNPIDKPTIQEIVKSFLGRKLPNSFVPEVFESKPVYKKAGDAKIIFMTRLWDCENDSVDKESYDLINQNRIEIIKKLRSTYGDRFYGGIHNSPLAHRLAPELIVNKALTERGHYLSVMKDSDICIATRGLYQSTGWKMAEYTAAAKGIVSEELFFTGIGDYEAGKNYLEFNSVDECISQVAVLMKDPQMLYEMKLCNEAYYRAYLRPDALVRRTLESL